MSKAKVSEIAADGLAALVFNAAVALSIILATLTN
jgi:hypothetical protein